MKNQAMKLKSVLLLSAATLAFPATSWSRNLSNPDAFDAFLRSENRLCVDDFRVTPGTFQSASFIPLNSVKGVAKSLYRFSKLENRSLKMTNLEITRTKSTLVKNAKPSWDCKVDGKPIVLCQEVQFPPGQDCQIIGREQNENGNYTACGQVECKAGPIECEVMPECPAPPLGQYWELPKDPVSGCVSSCGQLLGEACVSASPPEGGWCTANGVAKNGCPIWTCGVCNNIAACPNPPEGFRYEVPFNNLNCSCGDLVPIETDPPATCAAYFEGANYDNGTCVGGSASGCSSPFKYPDVATCERENGVIRLTDPPEATCSAYFTGAHFIGIMGKCVYGGSSGCTNPYKYQDLATCQAANPTKATSR
jgi:hypothetical protein